MLCIPSKAAHHTNRTGSRQVKMPLLFNMAYLFLWCLCCLPWYTCQAKTLHLSTSGTDQNGCGNTLQTPCKSLVYTLLNGASKGDTLLLEPGIYQETSKNTVVFGQVNGTSRFDLKIKASDPSLTVTIDRMYIGRLFEFDTDANDIIFENIRFYRGGWNVSDAANDYAGGLMRFTGSNKGVRFEKCTFESNRNPNKGYMGRAGVAAIAHGSPRFIDCYFNDNWGGTAGTIYVSGNAKPFFDGCLFENSGCADGGWGGVLVPEEQCEGIWQNCIFRNNTGDYGGVVDDGGTTTSQFINCTFENNLGRAIGGVYYGFGSARTQFRKCQFLGNRMLKGTNSQDFYLSSSVNITFQDCLFDSGPNPMLIPDGASGNARDASSLTMINCQVRGYRATQGVLHLTITATAYFEGCVFEDNECVKGGAIYSGVPTTIKKSLFRRNKATNGGAISFQSAQGSDLIIEDSIFEDNYAKQLGGAIRTASSSSAGKVVIDSCSFKNNQAEQAGGGAFYISPNVQAQINNSAFIQNEALSGGAILSEGLLEISNTEFRGNYLRLDDLNHDESDICSAGGGNGGAILSKLSDSEQAQEPNTDKSCDIPQLHFDNVRFISNQAPKGGGGGLYVDNFIPTCVTKPEDVCQSCTFDLNEALYGSDVASKMSYLDFLEPVQPEWTLSDPVNVTIGAFDVFGNRLAGGHSPVYVRVKLNPATNLDSINSTSTTIDDNVWLEPNSTRILRNGTVLFRDLMFRMRVGSHNPVDTDWNLTFTSSLSDRVTQKLSSSVQLLKCFDEEDIITNEYKCPKKSNGIGRDYLITIIVVCTVLVLAVGWTLRWAYKNTNRVLDGLRMLLLGAGGTIFKFAFEIADIYSDIQTLVNIFLVEQDVDSLLIKAAYVTCFVLSFIPSILLIRYSADHLLTQVTRFHTQSVQVSNTRNMISKFGPRLVSRNSLASKNAVQPSNSNGKTIIPNEFPMASLNSSLNLQQIVPNPIAQKVTSSSTTHLQKNPRSKTIVAAKFTLDIVQKQMEKYQQDIQYQTKRARLMKVMIVRLITEDFLLFVLNLYIYLNHYRDPKFFQSTLRSTLEFSILTSAIMLGSQLQSLAIWLQTNAINEATTQLQLLTSFHKTIEQLTLESEQAQNGQSEQAQNGQ